MWGIIPAAGRGSRIQPLAFSKELLPVGSKTEAGVARPCAVSEYLVERMILGGADKICFVIAPGKCDILQYFGAAYGEASTASVEQPQLFDAVVMDGDHVLEIQVKQQHPGSNWIWGAFKMPGALFRELRWLWEQRGREDEYFGTLVNAYLEAGGSARGVCAGEAYVDVGTLHGYRKAISFLGEAADGESQVLTSPQPELPDHMPSIAGGV